MQTVAADIPADEPALTPDPFYAPENHFHY